MGGKSQKGFKVTSSNKNQRNKILEARFKNKENTQDETNTSCRENLSIDDTSNSLKLKNEDFLLFNTTVQGIFLNHFDY